jgi:PEP-CTERM motif-containing protein
MPTIPEPTTIPAIAFDPSATIPSSVPPTPIVPIPFNFEPPDPCIAAATCEAKGPIIGYDSPVQIGTWDVRVVTPLPATLPLFATGLGGLGLLSWRRKRKNSTPLQP